MSIFIVNSLAQLHTGQQEGMNREHYILYFDFTKLVSEVAEQRIDRVEEEASEVVESKFKRKAFAGLELSVLVGLRVERNRPRDEVNPPNDLGTHC